MSFLMLFYSVQRLVWLGWVIISEYTLFDSLWCWLKGITPRNLCFILYKSERWRPQLRVGQWLNFYLFKRNFMSWNMSNWLSMDFLETRNIDVTLNNLTNAPRCKMGGLRITNEFPAYWFLCTKYEVTIFTIYSHHDKNLLTFVVYNVA